VLAYYVHHLSPYLVRFSEKWAIRYYGLAYVLAFVVAFLILRSLVRRDYYRDLKENQIGDLITWTAIFGVMLGGRLGYMLLYDHEEFFANPAVFFHILDGGMASHGGIAGVVVFTWFYARRHRISWLGLGDHLCVAAAPGILFVRLANFINGELYGRQATLSWAVQFPREMEEPGFPYFDGIAARARDMVEGDPITPGGIIEASRDNPALREILADFLTPRHPSQIYQALMEGLGLFLILIVIRLRFRNLPHGILTGLFFIFYAIFRIIGEQFRQPESGFGPIVNLTKGQFFSTFMILIGAAFIAAALGAAKRRRSSSP